MAPWRDEALKRGYRSCAALPFKRKGEIVGVLTLYAGEAGFFVHEERKLLDEIGENISFALDAMASESERRQTEKNLLHHAEALGRSNEELSRFNLVAVDRELRMMELKREVNELCVKLGEAPRHRIADEYAEEALFSTARD